MRPNPVRSKLRAGKPAFGTMAFEFFSPGLAQILADAGAEFVILDTEHSGVGIETVKQQVAYARGTGLSVFVRVPGLHYHLIAPVLDAGAMGIMVPMLETAEQAKKLAAWCRYRPEGVRGLAFAMPHDDYTGGDIVTKMRRANARTLTIALVETAEGIRNIDAIAAVPGIDLVWVGHYDLSNSMGISGQFDHPDFRAAIRKVVLACRRHRKPAGVLVPDVAAGRAWMRQGFRAICYSTDISVFSAAMRAGFEGLRKR
jgi:2-keto-3-deoxy-L-rhamnonate aldolase RhmA